MFEALSEKLSKVFSVLGNKGKLSEKDIDEALRQVRLSLLEADVNFQVVKGFLAKIRERSLQASVLESLTPAQQIIKIVNEELVGILGGAQSRLVTTAHPPGIVMLVGLQGSGKTTTAAKLALHLRHEGQRPLLVAADTRRPAAIDQLQVLGKQLNIPVYSEDASRKPVDICKRGVEHAKSIAASWIILDTGGRLHVDEDLMKELKDIASATQPGEVLLVVDAMTGQDAVRVAQDFHSKVGLTGLVLTKMDGDARGGAALSIKSVTGLPVKFMGVGEKTDALEPFYPERIASRILGMGDMLTLIEKAENTFDEKRAKELEKKIQNASFDLEDFLEQLKQIKKMGSLSQLMEMVPGFSNVGRRLPQDAFDEKRLKRIEAIILSMTPEERKKPDIIEGKRKRRISQGSGTYPQDVNQLLNQFQQMQKMMKQFSSGKKFKFPMPFR
ncbi:MAG: signal recognition particle protein [Dehalococcoidia bacterium]|nr:signal recognition particle protein [Dehalococcoidia bacterium]MDZ4247632.1 signal recognition particle protein [Dehalococcoidia bacterium]